MNKIRQYIKDVLEKNPQAWMDGKSPLELFLQGYIDSGRFNSKIDYWRQYKCSKQAAKNVWMAMDKVRRYINNLDESEWEVALDQMPLYHPDSKKVLGVGVLYTDAVLNNIKTGQVKFLLVKTGRYISRVGSDDLEALKRFKQLIGLIWPCNDYLIEVAYLYRNIKRVMTIEGVNELLYKPNMYFDLKDKEVRYV